MKTLADLLPGTLDLLVLKAASLGPLHGYGILLRIQQISRQMLQIEQGSLYPALYRLEHAGLIESEWGVSDNNRRAKFYQLTRTGHARLRKETEQWTLVLDSRRPCPGRATGGTLMQDRLKALARMFRRSASLGPDMDDEMDFHISQYRDDLVKKRGFPPAEAARRARQEFGNIGLRQEECREAGGFSLFDEFLRNVTFALRQLRRSPGFAISAILTLGLCASERTRRYSA